MRKTTRFLALALSAVLALVGLAAIIFGGDLVVDSDKKLIK